MSVGADLALIRERKPLVHQITNFVVMNETANATLAIGALPVMAHALQEVEEMASVASALVLNIGTLSDEWVEAMIAAGRAANAARVPVVLDPVGAGATKLTVIEHGPLHSLVLNSLLTSMLWSMPPSSLLKVIVTLSPEFTVTVDGSKA